MVTVNERLAYFAGLAYGDGYPEYGEIRIVTAVASFRVILEDLVRTIADDFGATWRIRQKQSAISERPEWELILNSTTARRALFEEDKTPRYDALHSIALDRKVAPEFQAGLTDAEGSILPPTPIDSPHGRIFAMRNSDRRLLGIARLSLVNAIRLEPTSVRTRLDTRRERKHWTKGVLLINRKNNYLIEILSGAKRKWLERVGSRLRHPRKRPLAEQLIETYPRREEHC